MLCMYVHESCMPMPMTRVQLLIPDEDHAERFGSRSDVERFFASCDERHGSGPEPDWEQHLAVIRGSRGRGAATE